MKRVLLSLLLITAIACADEAPQTRTAPRDGMPQIRVPAAQFIMGTDADDAFGRTAEFPPHKVRVDAFWIDAHEVTQGQFAAFLNEVAAGDLARMYDCVDLANEVNHFSYDAETGTVSVPERWADHPVGAVSWRGASAYAQRFNRRLPTEAEWELAARGTEGRRYPWGDEWDPENTVTSEGSDGTAPVGSTPGDQSPYGVADMGGNVMEWVADVWQEDFYSQSPVDNPKATGQRRRGVARGGAWCLTEWDSRATSRKRQAPYAQRRYMGFRCAEDVLEPLPPPAAVGGDVLFYAPMDGSVHAAAAGGRRHALRISRQPDFAEGHHGQAALLGEDADGRYWVDYASEGNIDYDGGTLSMWVKPVGWSGADPGFRFFFIVRDPDRIRFYLYKFTTGGLTAIAGNGVNGEWAHISHDISDWQDGQWVHLAMTWTESELALYEDGEPISEKHIPEKYRFRADAPYFSIGQSQDWDREPVPREQTAIDEVVIFNRPLSAAEIREEMQREDLP